MVRISDARMSGTAFGTIVLHVTPDSASGGPLGLVRNGDLVRLSVKERRIDLLVEDAELKKRAAVAKYVWGKPERGYAKALPRSDGIGRLWSSDIRDDLHTLPLASCQSSGEQG